jgi:hypothetical protein
MGIKRCSYVSYSEIKRKIKNIGRILIKEIVFVMKLT